MKAREFDEKFAEGTDLMHVLDISQAKRINQVRKHDNTEMRIDRLEIRNFRCFEHRAFEFDPRFTLLIGANATGKTAVLEALAVALGAVLTPVPDAASRGIGRRDVRRIYRFAGETGHFEDQYPARIEAGGSFGGRELVWVRELKSAKSRTTRGETREIRRAMSDLIRQSIDNDHTVYPCIGYYGTDRFGLGQRRTAKGVDPSGRNSRYIGYQGCLTPTSSPRYLTAWIKRLALIEAQRGEPLKTLRAVYEAIAACVENALAAEFDFEEDDIVVEFGNDTRAPFQTLSDGQRSMGAIAADIAMRCSQLNPHLNDRASAETPGIVLIDELDLHLHPRWQRGVIEDLGKTFPRLQFIATSHSPFIIQSVSEGGVINLDQGDDLPETPELQSIEDVAENIMGVEQPQQSQRFQKMVTVAEEYFQLIESASAANDSEKVKSLRERLDELEEPFANNPAYVAFLRLQRTGKNLQ